MQLEVSTCDGKYTVQQTDDGNVYVLRFGQPWRGPVYDKAILALAQDLREVRDVAIRQQRKVTELAERAAETQDRYGCRGAGKP